MAGRAQARLSGVLLGIGMGGFLDGIVLHQILQWHNLLSSQLPPTSMAAMRTNMHADGWFHVGTWVVTALAVVLLWGVAQARGPLPPFRWYLGNFLAGWGLFNLVEGIVDHHVLQLHHVRGYPDPVWDYGFVVIGGAGLMLLGIAIARSATRDVVTYSRI